MLFEQRYADSCINHWFYNVFQAWEELNGSGGMGQHKNKSKQLFARCIFNCKNQCFLQKQNSVISQNLFFTILFAQRYAHLCINHCFYNVLQAWEELNGYAIRGCMQKTRQDMRLISYPHVFMHASMDFYRFVWICYDFTQICLFFCLLCKNTTCNVMYITFFIII